MWCSRTVGSSASSWRRIEMWGRPIRFLWPLPAPETGVLEPTWYHTGRLYNDTKTRSWDFRSSDMLYPADFDGDGLQDLYVVNLTAWNQPYLCMLKSLGDRFVP